ncbi:sensor histidine kinase [Amycolatopsis thailandensis]|uniref:sensor histidine kinase n=1 Tax=Amycolatopsis thailandensis TaxID=589330 RepID=UPI003624CC4A
MIDEAIEVLLDAIPGAVLVTRDGLVVGLNAGAIDLLGSELIGHPAPPALAGLGALEKEVRLTSATGEALHVAISARPSPAGITVHVLRDVTEQRWSQDRVAALARTAARVSAQSTTTSLLHAMAEEVHAAEGIAAVQIITAEPGGENLAIMGATGFDDYPDFFDRLMACRDLGAPLATLKVMRTGKQWIHRDRKRFMLDADFYRPLHDYVARLDWRDFVATPMVARGRAIGALLVYVRSKHVIVPALTGFLCSMAEQAALAIDYHRLIERSRIQVRIDERQRLARDLHDSVLQQLFALGMQARGLEALGARTRADPAVLGHARDIQELAKSLQRDLRAIVQGMRKTIVSRDGLRRALVALVEETSERTGIMATVEMADASAELDVALADDLYGIISEGVHNVVKHALAHTVTVSVTMTSGQVAAVVEDDGVGPSGTLEGYGLASMRYRASRWGGTIRVQRFGDRTRLTATLSSRPEETRS